MHGRILFDLDKKTGAGVRSAGAVSVSSSLASVTASPEILMDTGKNLEHPAALRKEGSPARASLWFGAALYFNSGLLFLSTPVFTRLLSTSEFGQVVLYNSWSTVIGIFATLSLSAGVYYNAMLEFADDLDAYTSSMIGLTTVSVLVCFLMVVAVYGLSGDFTGLGLPLIGFMFVALLFNAVLMFWRARERFHYRYRLVVGISIPSSLIGILAAIALVAWIPAHRVESRIVAAVLPALAVGMVFYVLLVRKGGKFYSRKYWGYALAMNVPLLPHYLSQAFLLQFDRFAIERASGKADVGIYGLAYAVAMGITLFWTAINASWLPWMLRKLREGKIEEIAVRAKDLTGVVALVCILFSLVAPEIVHLLAPQSYGAAATVVPALLFASFLQFAQSIFLNVQFFRKRSTAIMACSILAALMNVSLNLWLIGIFGFSAAAYVIAASQLFQLAFHYVVVRRLDRIRVMAGRYLLGVTAGAALVTIISMEIQQQRELRWILFTLSAILLAAVVYKRMPRSPLTGGGDA